MRKLLIIAACLLLIPITVYAHPGRTDGSGGHYNRSTGEYHYHHGYSAHDHYDMDGDGDKDCPYDYDYRVDNSVHVDLPEEDVEEESKMFKEILGSVFIFLSSLFFIIPLGLFAGFFLILGCTIVTYPLSRLLFSKDSDRGDRFSTITSVSISIAILLYWVLPDFVNFLLESAANIIVFIFFVLMLIGIVVYICYASDIENKKIIKSKNEAIDDLRNKNAHSAEMLKNAVSFSERLKEELDREKEQNANIKKFNSSEREIASKNIDRLQREVRQAKNDRYSLLKEKQALINEVDELKRQIRLYETGHTVRRPKIHNLPEDVYFVDGLPVAGQITEFNPFGRFTVYASAKGTRYHADELCGGKVLQPIHLFEAIPNKQRCTKCGNDLPDSLPDWYVAFKKVK